MHVHSFVLFGIINVLQLYYLDVLRGKTETKENITCSKIILGTVESNVIHFDFQFIFQGETKYPFVTRVALK
jgi:hypothetical protein